MLARLASTFDENRDLTQARLSSELVVTRPERRSNFRHWTSNLTRGCGGMPIRDEITADYWNAGG